MASDTGEVSGNIVTDWRWGRQTTTEGGRWTHTHTHTLGYSHKCRRTPRVPTLLWLWGKAWLFRLCCGVISDQQSMPRSTQTQNTHMHIPKVSPFSVAYSRSLAGHRPSFPHPPSTSPQHLLFTNSNLFASRFSTHLPSYLMPPPPASHHPPKPIPPSETPKSFFRHLRLYCWGHTHTHTPAHSRRLIGAHTDASEANVIFWEIILHEQECLSGCLY